MKSAQEIIYQNVNINYLPQLGEANLTLNTVPSQKIPGSDRISINIPIVENSITVQSTPENNLFLSNVINCDNFNSGKIDRTISPNGFLYSATNSIACDQLNLKHFPHATGYAVIADVQNQAGLFPTVCLENHSSRRCDVFERLINGAQMIIQPINNSNEDPGYTLHLFNQSFGTRQTENLIKSVIVTPLPLNFLKNISLASASNSDSITSTVPFTSTHPAEFLYTVSINNTSTSSTLDLYQTKSPYWKALEVSQNDFKLHLAAYRQTSSPLFLWSQNERPYNC